MKNNNEKGFALVLSLLLLVVMSLMGGALIVISSGDHQSNNSSDQYQQAFYVAETALIEGEKEIINKMMGPWTKTTALGSLGLDSDISDFLSSMAVGDMVRNTEAANLPLNRENGDDGTPILNKDSECFKSFRNIDRDNFIATKHVESQHFYQLIEEILNDESNIIDALELEGTSVIDIAKKRDAEIFQLKKFYFEYFSTYIGIAEFKAAGSSLKKTSTNAQTQGHVYKIYGCGIMKGGSGDPTELQPFEDGENDILIPLETVIIVS